MTSFKEIPTTNARDISWELPPNYYIASIHFYRVITEHRRPVEIYMCYEQHEDIEGKSIRVASGQTGRGETFEEALADGLNKLTTALDQQRARMKEVIRNPPVVQGLRKDDKPVNIAGLEGLKLDLDL